MPPAVVQEHALEQPVSHVRWLHAGLASLRIAMGSIFLWAFLDKLIGLGYSTPASRSWLNGGNPTQGYLGSSEGPMAGVFKAMAGDPFVNVLFMGGLAAVGLALLLGIGVRIAGVSGALMMVLMWASHLPPTTNPLIDDHIVYAIVLLLMPALHVGDHAGLGPQWKRLALVRRYPILE